MEDIFKVGDRVFCYNFGGWGTVIKKNESNYAPFRIRCSFPIGDASFTHDGRFYKDSPPILSFTEYTLEGFSQERPEELPSRGDIVWIKEMDTKMYVPIVFMEAINDDYVLSFNFINIKVVNKDFVLTKNPYTNEQ